MIALVFDQLVNSSKKTCKYGQEKVAHRHPTTNRWEQEIFLIQPSAAYII